MDEAALAGGYWASIEASTGVFWDEKDGTNR